MNYEQQNEPEENKLDKDTPRIPSARSAEEMQQMYKAEQDNKDAYLKELGIDLLPKEELAKMSFGEVSSYQVDMKNKIFGAQNNLPPNDRDASRTIFDQALSRVDAVRNPADLERLKNEYKSSGKKKTGEPMDEVDKMVAEAGGFARAHPERRSYPNVARTNLYGAIKKKKK